MDNSEADNLKNLKELKNITQELKNINSALRPKKEPNWIMALLYGILGIVIVYLLYISIMILYRSIL
ncbi:hypothetical protein PL321_07695 [Caloramator sp. mosi_1]|uniref:hypothetical protein n=1 Tax=Caloramator sp. mosi_1 TaxID=3023090 RepID=UPI002362CA4D|nr:hypothetical protein [Caloramator sp. mosi_1]WDC85313.1 hypothetical protein PL321_07695 [Caloramator sp. mosi_1]